MFFFPRTYSLNKEGVLYTDEYDLSVNDLLYLEKKRGNSLFKSRVTVCDITMQAF